MGGDGGLIVVGYKGEIVLFFNLEGMYWGWVWKGEKVGVVIY